MIMNRKSKFAKNYITKKCLKFSRVKIRLFFTQILRKDPYFKIDFSCRQFRKLKFPKMIFKIDFRKFRF